MNNDPEVSFNSPEYECVDAAVAHFRNMCELPVGLRLKDLEALRDRMHDVLIAERQHEMDVWTR